MTLLFSLDLSHIRCSYCVRQLNFSARSGTTAIESHPQQLRLICNDSTAPFTSDLRPFCLEEQELFASSARSGTTAPQTAERLLLSQPDLFEPAFLSRCTLPSCDCLTTPLPSHTHRSSFTLVGLTLHLFLQPFTPSALRHNNLTRTYTDNRAPVDSKHNPG